MGRSILWTSQSFTGNQSAFSNSKRWW